MTSRLTHLVGVLTLALASAPPLRALQQDSSSARTVITIDSLDRAAFANVAELLQARVPGLHIARTGDGAMRWFMRGPSSTSESTPMVLIDDMQINMASSAMRDIGTRPPLLDEIDIEDVERIEVSSGPATALTHGPGSGNGLIRIVTFAPRAQRTSFQIASSAGTLHETVSYPNNAIRAGVDTAGAPFTACSLWMEAIERCTPTGPPILLNPLESESPYETGITTRVTAALASGTERLAWRGRATFDRQGATSGSLASQRLHLRGAGALRAGPSADVTVRAHWMRGDADLVSPEQTVLRQGLLSRPDAPWPGFQDPRVSPYNSTRYGATTNASWRPREWLSTRLTGGVERMADEDDLEYTISGGALEVDSRGERRRRDLTARLDGEARYGTGSLYHATGVTIERVVSKQEEEFSEVQTLSGGASGGRGFWINLRTAIAGVALTQRLQLGERTTLAGGLRLDQVRLNDVRWDVPLAPHVSLSWDARRFVPNALGGVRLRAALADVANVPQTTRIIFYYFTPEGRPKAEVTRERELGLDATAAHDRLGLSFTWYTKRTNNVGNAVGPNRIFERIEVLNRGVEASLQARIVRTSRFAWDARAWYAYNHNELTRGTSDGLELEDLSVRRRQWIAQGQPLGAYRAQPILTVSDLDGDGLIDNACYDNAAPCEAVVRLTGQFRPAYPPTSASLETSFRFGPVTLSALLDHRSGHAMHNSIFEQRCGWQCQALYDPSTSLRDQAEAFLASGGAATTIYDAGFTKLREISLRVAGPASWARGLGAARLDVSLAARNVATWTDYPGLDPEATSFPWIPLASLDNGAGPLPRRFTLRVDLHGR